MAMYYFGQTDDDVGIVSTDAEHISAWVARRTTDDYDPVIGSMDGCETDFDAFFHCDNAYMGGSQEDADFFDDVFG